MSQEKVLYSIARYLSSLKGKTISTNDENIDTIITLLEATFGTSVIEDSVENFENLAYFPVELNEIFDVGIEKLQIDISKEALIKAQNDPKFQAFSDLVTAKGFYKDCEVGSLDYLQRQAKLVNKFNSKAIDAAASTLEKETQADEKKSLGNTAIANKDYESAIRYYTEAIEILPDGTSSHVYYCNRAAAYCYLNQHEFSIEDCETAIQLNDTYAKAYSRLGLSNFFLGRYEEAIKAYEKLVELEPNNTSHQDELRKVKKKLEKRQLSTSASSSSGRDSLINSRNAAGGGGGGNNNTKGGAPDLSALASMLGGGGAGGGMPPGGLDGLLNKNPQMKNAFDNMGGMNGLSEIMKDPNMMAMAQNMMKNPAMMQQAMSMMNSGGAGGGDADFAAMLGAVGDGSGAAPSSSGSSGGRTNKKNQPFKGFEDVQEDEAC